MKIAVHGSYFGYNFGDTLLCRLFNEWTKQHELVDTTVLPLANRKNQNAILADQRGIVAALGADAFIFCGGGYFSEASRHTRKWAMRAFLRHLFLARAIRHSGRPLAILGVGVGPVSSIAVRREILETFKYAETVAVRDAESAAMLSEWGLRRDISVVPDAVAVSNLRGMFGLERSQTAKDGRQLVVHTSGQPSRGELEAVRHICEWGLGQKAIEIILVTDGISRRRSIAWPQAIIDDYPQLNARIRLYDGDVDGMIAFLAEVDGIVTTKLHVGIVGTMLGIPVISIPHHAKTVRFFRQAGLADRVVDQHSSHWHRDLDQLLVLWLNESLRVGHALPAENPYLRFIGDFLARKVI